MPAVLIKNDTLVFLLLIVSIFSPFGCSSNRSPYLESENSNAISYCTVCHGSDESSAPPRDLYGNIDTAFRGVGAHRSHLQESDLSMPVDCTECHFVPAIPSDPGHMDTALPAEITFGTLSTKSGASPSWDGTKCTNVYCHGSTLDGTGLREPVWTTVDWSQARCKEACHEMPPSAGGHPDRMDCGLCHAPTVASNCDFVVSDCTIADKSTHINGELNGNFSCNSCHGSSTNDAPPVDTAGNSSTTLRSVGAHQKHLIAGTYRVAIPCNECHNIPASVSDAGHIDSALPAEVAFGGLAKAEDSNPSWDGNKCTNVYCHGASISGAALTNPVWTIVDGTQTECGTGCHQLPSGGHPHSIPNCGDCHQPTVAPDCDVSIAPCEIVDKITHINGDVELND